MFEKFPAVKRQRKNSKTAQIPFHTLNVNESFIVPESFCIRSTVTSAAHRYSKKHNVKLTVSLHGENDSIVTRLK